MTTVELRPRKPIEEPLPGADRRGAPDPTTRTRERETTRVRAERHFGPLRALGWLFVFAILVAGALVGALVYRIAFPPAEPAPVTEVLEPSPDVVVAVRDLARLETASFHMERVIDLRERQQTLFGLVQAEDAILLVAAADVSAGVDLTKLQDGDIVVEETEHARRAVLTLPAPEIFTARLDNDRTYVHSRETDALAERSAELESRARRAAERSLRESAVEAGLIERARANAESSLRTLVEALGVDEVVFRWKDAESGEQRGEETARVTAPSE